MWDCRANPESPPREATQFQTWGSGIAPPDSGVELPLGIVEAPLQIDTLLFSQRGPILGWRILEAVLDDHEPIERMSVLGERHESGEFGGVCLRQHLPKAVLEIRNHSRWTSGDDLQLHPGFRTELAVARNESL